MSSFCSAPKCNNFISFLGFLSSQCEADVIPVVQTAKQAGVTSTEQEAGVKQEVGVNLPKQVPTEGENMHTYFVSTILHLVRLYYNSA